MIAQILPLDTSHDSEWLTYFVPENLRNMRVGQLVEIPFREEITQGIVASLREYDGEIPDEVRAVVSIVFAIPVLSEAQVQTILEIAKLSVIHTHKVLALFLTKPVLHRMLKYGIPANENSVSSPRNIPAKPVLHFLRESSELASYAASLRVKRTAYIVPSDWYVSRLKEALSWENLGIFSGELTETKRAQLWLDIRAGKYQTLIWTRRLCTYNLDEFDWIIYLEDAIMKEMLHSFHRYSCLSLTERLTKHAHQEFHIVSTTPAISTLARTLATHFELRNA